MTDALSDAFLILAAASVWLGCAGFMRLQSAYDRLHCVTFVSVSAGSAVMLAGWLHLGASVAMLKVVFLVCCALLNGAVLAHATGRAILHRERSSKGSPAS